jgi:hypothetical protein
LAILTASGAAFGTSTGDAWGLQILKKDQQVLRDF